MSVAFPQENAGYVEPKVKARLTWILKSTKSRNSRSELTKAPYLPSPSVVAINLSVIHMPAILLTALSL